MGVKVVTDHEDDHGHGEEPQERQVSPRQQGGAGQDGRGVDAGKTSVHEGDP